jgi:hypothetical protein
VNIPLETQRNQILLGRWGNVTRIRVLRDPIGDKSQEAGELMEAE